MSMLKNIYKMALIASTLFSSLYSQVPVSPIIQKDICPFECCQFGIWKTLSPLSVYEVEGNTNNPQFIIPANESFTAINGNVHMIRPGLVILRRSIDKFSIGDTVYTLSYRGEGFNDILYHGKIFCVEMFWQTDDEMDYNNIKVGDAKWNNIAGVLISKPVMVWWVKIRDKDSREGWIRLENKTVEGFFTEERIEGMDGCGG